MLKKFLVILSCLLTSPLQSMENSISNDVALIQATTDMIEMSGIEILVENLLYIGASPLARDEKGQTALHLSAQAGKVKLVKALLDAHCPVDIRTNDPLRSTALHIAIVNGYKDVINLLIARGANANAEDRLGICPFHTAIIHNDLETLKLLVRHGADLDRTVSLGNMSTLELASEKGSRGLSPEIFTFVLEQGATCSEGYEALARKIEKTRPQFAEQLRNIKPKAAHCVVCKSAPKVLKMCSVCKKVRYCNASCQRKHWPAHKAVCKPAEDSEILQKDIAECSICLNPLRNNVVNMGGACVHTIHAGCRALLVGNKNFNEMCPLCRAYVPKA